MSALRNNRTPKSGRQSLFFQDLATPISSSAAGGGPKAKFSSPGQVAVVSALWRENFGGGGSDLPPPPVFTLDDRSDFSPESCIADFPKSPKYPSPSSSGPTKLGRSPSFATPVSSSKTTARVLESGSPSAPPTSSWGLTPAGGRVGGSGEKEEKGKGSPVEGVIQSSGGGGGGLLTLPPPREVARPEMVVKKSNSLPAGRLDEEEWVTVYGFSPGDTNLVLREFEKCGVILKHVPGPRESNWIHILYQSRSDAQKSLSKNGMQINGVLIIGVKLVDPIQQQALNERLKNQGFMTMPPPASTRTSEANALRASPRPYYLQNGSSSARQSGGAIATPAKSAVSKIFDVMFGI